MNVSANPRLEVLMKIATERKIKFNGPSENASEYFGINTFNEKVMRERLPKDDFRILQETMKQGKKLDMKIANSVAHAMKEWARSRGVTHYTHWFQPQTGLTAEKHDSFLELDGSNVIERFKGSQLVQGEPDASSFPSGGARTTFEARGYTMWDPSSPAFIVDGPNGGILCIPSVFISYTGDALDKKMPLIRSMETLSNSALKVLQLMGNEVATRVVTTVGTEQEYFLVDKYFYFLRPDLMFTGRTLQGAPSPKGQQLDDHYFGAIKERVLSFMQDAEHELYKLGVPATTRHNEVAPHQFEIAPIFAEANVAADRNQIIMEVLKKVANRHDLAMLLHEKPFAGINGSGKHNNWSMSDSEGNNLLDPGDTPELNLQFLIFLVATLMAVHKYGGLLRMSIASAGNDHRLGANEAPPAIISVFLGERLSTILNDIKKGKKTKKAEDYIINMGIDKLPPILRDNTDRNRTSPFAFTGQKFEFRAVGSSASVSLSNTVLSTAVAESIDIILADIEGLMKKDSPRDEAILSVLQKYVIETEDIRFEGNNYSKEWEEEAARRGLPNVKKTGYALDFFITKENINLLTSRGIFRKEEILNRYNTKMEQYLTALEIEAETLCDLMKTRVLPAAIAAQNKLVGVVKGLLDIGSVLGNGSTKVEINELKELKKLISSLTTKCDELEHHLEKAEKISDLSKKGKYFSDHITVALDKVRVPADELEAMIPDDLWPLPKYSEMLFIM